MRKIAWFTPFQKNSAIGRYSRYAVEALSADFDVTLFAVLDGEMQQAKVPVRYFTEQDDLGEELEDFDHIVYNMGDHAPYHKSLFKVARVNPGIIIAHDVSLFNFVNGFLVSEGMQPAFRVILEQLYHEDSGRIVFDINNEMTKWRVDLVKYNMIEYVCKNATGVIVHSDYHAKMMAKSYSGPVAVLPLIKMQDFVPGEKSDAFGGYPADKVSIVSVGYVNFNKLADRVLDAFAQSRELQNSAYYAIVGDAHDLNYLGTLEHKMNIHRLRHCAKITGRVDDATLKAYYDNADIVCNLRMPAIEGGSATLQEQMYMGKAVVVVDTGIYQDLPDDCVAKVDPKNMEQSLRQTLERLAQDREYREELGRRAREFAQAHYAPEEYVRRFCAFAAEDGPVDFLRPYNFVLEILRQDVHKMGMQTDFGWPRLKVLDNLAQEMETLFGRPE